MISYLVGDPRLWSRFFTQKQDASHVIFSTSFFSTFNKNKKKTKKKKKNIYKNDKIY